MRLIRIAFRNSFQDKMSFLNFAGLSLGLLSSMVIALFIWSEFSHDTSYPDYKKIFRITTNYKVGENEAKWALNHGIIDQELADNLSGIDKSTAFIGIQQEKVFYVGNLAIISDKGFYVDDEFFDVFGYDFIYGNRSNALRLPNSVVVTASFAIKMFGTTDVLHREIFQDPNEKSPLIIGGIIEDPPQNSYMKFDYVITSKSYPSWDFYYSGKSGNMFYIFFKTLNEEEPLELQGRVDLSLQMIKKELLGSEYEPSETFRMDNIVQRVDQIYFNAKNEFEISAGGNFNYTLLVLLVGIFISLILIINHINLSISSSFSKRKIKEFAIRKLVGSSRIRLLINFVTEVSLSVLGAMVIAIILLRFTIDLWPGIQKLIIDPFDSIEFYLALLVGWALISLLTALFPAFKFMSFNIIQASKGRIQVGNEGFLSVRNILVVAQIVFTALLLSNSSLLYRQLSHLINLDPGYRTSQIIEIKRTSNMSNSEWNNFLTQTKSISGIVSVGSSNFPHISDLSNATVAADIPESPRVKIAWNSIDYDFAETLNLEILNGRTFSPDFLSDSSAVIINETAVKAFGLDDPVGMTITMWGGPLHVIGVVRDFHFQNFTKPISPTLLRLNASQTWIAYVQHNTNSKAVIENLENIWFSVHQDSPFEYAFLNDNYESLVSKEKETAWIVTAFTIVAIILAALGIVGLIGNDANQRIKEIAIKKILGAPISQIVYLINRRFILILVAGFLISVPLAIWTGNYWLQLFAFKVSLNNSDFLFALISTAIVGALVSSLITIGAANSNPVNVIRNE